MVVVLVCSGGGILFSFQTDTRKKNNFQAAGRDLRIYTALKDPKFNLYCHFIMANIALFDTFNLLLQRDEPCVHILRTKCIELLTDLLVKFVKIEAFRSAGDVLKVKFKERANQKSDADLVIGSEAKDCLRDIEDDDVKYQFFDSVREYYVEGCSYIMAKFPIEEEWLKHAEVVDITKRVTSNFKSVSFFVNKLELSDIDIDRVEHEFLRFQIDRLDMLGGDDRIDEKWGKLIAVYPGLAEVMLSVLTIPHGNADSERVFSAVRHIDTDFRQRMSWELMDALMVVKRHLITRGEICYTHKFTDEFLARAKGATYQGLKMVNEQSESESCKDIIGADVTGQVLQMLAAGESCVDPHVK